MRVTTETNPLAHVYLNGQEVQHVVWADDEKGIVIYLEHDNDGIKLDDSGDPTQLRATGYVEIIKQRSDVACPRCNSEDLAKIKGCVVCLTCHFKQDCNGW